MVLSTWSYVKPFIAGLEVWLLTIELVTNTHSWFMYGIVYYFIAGLWLYGYVHQLQLVG